MLLSRQLYWLTVGFTLLFFFLFIRLFVWKVKAERDYWSKRPHLTHTTLEQLARRKRCLLPYITLMVPARNEAAVIARTIDHLCQLNYPADRYEVIIVSDEKEEQANNQACEALIDKLKGHLIDHGDLHAKLCFQYQGFERLLATLLIKILLDEPQTLSSLPEQLRGKARLSSRDDLQAMLLLLCSTPKLRKTYAETLLDRHFPNETEVTRRQMLPSLLDLAFVLRQVLFLLKEPPRQAAQARMHQELTRVPAQMRQNLELWFKMQQASLLQKLEDFWRDPHVMHNIQDLYREAFPTTQSIVQDKLNQMRRNSDMHRLRHIVTPYDFDGRYNGECVGRSVPSTKGRALNYALPLTQQQTEMIGFYDAESRPEGDVLLYVAWRRLQEGKGLKLLQGPVFQVRNFYEMGPLSKLAGLYQSIAHDWYLPVLFDQIPFLGGTNVYIDYELIGDLQGFDAEILTEDLELGARAWLQRGAWPEYLPYYSSEQTPPSARGFFRQRLRWGAGHLQVMEKLKASPEYRESRTQAIYWRLFVKGQLEWLFFQLGSFVPIGVFLVQLLGRIEPEIPPPGMSLFYRLLTLAYLVFTFYAFKRYRPIMDDSGRPRTIGDQLLVWASIATLPIATLFFTVPYTAAWVRKLFNREQRLWEKTPRSQE